jgi:hypothetical protein
VAVKDAVIEEKKNATVLFGDQLSRDSGNEEKMELQETAL